MDSNPTSESPAVQSGTRVSRYLLLLPAAAVIVLCIPVLNLNFIWDDYNFLTHAMFYQLHDWAPDPVDPFYRPISRGVYFSLLDLAGRNGALLGHLFNLGFLIGLVYLLGSFTARIAGKKAGLLAGVIFTGFGAAPALVAWVCLDQDLLAITFVLTALHLRLGGRNGAAVAATAAALFSKETTLAAIPALVLFDWIAGRKPHRIWKSAVAYGLLVAAWVAIHPAVRTLVARGLRSGATGYVGLEHPERWPIHLGRYLLALFNFPAFYPLPGWPEFGIVALVAALAIVIAALRIAARAPRAQAEGAATWPRQRTLLLGVFLAAGPLILTSTMVRGWSPYYAAFPAIGISMIAGVLLAPLTLRAQVITLALYFTLGMWTRGDVQNPEESTESNFRIVGKALRQVEAGFRHLYPAFPPGGQLLLSVQARGRGSIYIHMYVFQVLRLWYRDRSILVLRPEARRPTAGPEILAVITPDRDVIDINPATVFARSASGKEPDYNACEGAVRAYATGLAGSGNSDAAVNLLLHMPEVNRGLEIVHRRMAAMFLLAEGRDEEGEAILRATSELPRGLALADLNAVLAEQPPGRTYDEYALRAFGISSGDTDAIRSVMRWFAKMKYVEAALRFAQRLEHLKPGDAEAVKVSRKMEAVLEERRKAPPGPANVE